MPPGTPGRTTAEEPVVCSGGRFKVGSSGKLILGIDDTGGFGVMLESFPLFVWGES
jgi:hypothetical protein